MIKRVLLSIVALSAISTLAAPPAHAAGIGDEGVQSCFGTEVLTFTDVDGSILRMRIHHWGRQTCPDFKA